MSRSVHEPYRINISRYRKNKHVSDNSVESFIKKLSTRHRGIVRLKFTMLIHRNHGSIKYHKLNGVCTGRAVKLNCSGDCTSTESSSSTPSVKYLSMRLYAMS